MEIIVRMNFRRNGLNYSLSVPSEEHEWQMYDIREEVGKQKSVRDKNIILCIEDLSCTITEREKEVRL